MAARDGDVRRSQPGRDPEDPFGTGVVEIELPAGSASSSGTPSFIGRTGNLDSIVDLDASARVTTLARVGDLGVLLHQAGTVAFDPNTLDVVFESELFGRVGDIYRQ